jgi:outer membrane immunogenic protein
MKRIALAIAGALVAMAPAAAAERAIDSWTGFYLGANGGYGWGSRHADFSPNCTPGDGIGILFGPCPPSPPGPPGFGGTVPPPAKLDADGGLAGIQGGYNWQFGRSFVIGVEADYDWGKVDGSGVSSFLFIPQGTSDDPRSAIVVSETIKELGTVRARLGWLPRQDLMLYATGGFAYARVSETANTFLPGGVNSGGGPFAFKCSIGVSCLAGASTRTAMGFAAGAGAEFALSDHISIRAEYLYVGLNGASLNTIATVAPPRFSASSFTTRFDSLSLNVARIGVSYRFDAMP